MTGKNEKDVIAFDEALRRIANTPKSIVLEGDLKSDEKQTYNKSEATKKPPQIDKVKS